MGICQGPECDREAERTYCEAHRKQLQRRGTMTPIQAPMSPEEAALLAGNDWLEAEDEDEYRKARSRYLVAMERWMRARGWRPPPPPKPIPCCCHLVQLDLPLRARRVRTMLRLEYRRGA